MSPPSTPAYDQLTAAGHHGELAPFDAFWGMRYATVHDPDGTGIDLFAQLPGEAAAGSAPLRSVPAAPSVASTSNTDPGRRTPPSKCDGPTRGATALLGV